LSERIYNAKINLGGKIGIGKVKVEKNKK